MGSILNHLPVKDWDAHDWVPTGASNTSLWQCWNNDDDTQYAKSPAHKGQGIVSYPIDITAIPAGSIITSITLQARAATGTGTPPPGVSPSLTVAISCNDDTSRTMYRTINPSATPTTTEVATFKKDCLGLDWDIERINHILVGCFSYEGIFDLIRCYKLFCVINYRLAPTVTILSPSGTVLTSSPTISWTYRQTDGDPQVGTEYKLFTATQAALPSFSPDITTPIFSGKVSGDISSFVLPTSLDPDNYLVYLRSQSNHGAKSIWTGRQFAVSGPAPASPGVGDISGAQPPGVGVVATIADPASGSAILTIQDVSNMLSVQDADAETITDGTALTGTNCSFARDATKAFPTGSACWSLTSTASGNMSLVSDWVEIAPSQPITIQAQMMAATVGRNCSANVTFYDDSFTSVGSISGSSTADSTATWTLVQATGTSPATATQARVTWTVAATGAGGEVHKMDRLGLSYGTGTPWSDGGHMSRNLLSAWYSTAEGTAQSGEAWTASAGATLTQVATSGTGASGSTCNQLTYVGTTPTLAYRAAGSSFTTPTSGKDYTLNRPAGVALGDLMLAFIQCSSITTILPPAGWSLVEAVSAEDGTFDPMLFVLKRTATGSEPTTWTDGSFADATAERVAVVVAYSGAADASTQFVATASVATGNNTPAFVKTPTVSNTDPNAWRVTAFAFSDDHTGGTQTSNAQPPGVIPPIAFVGSATAWTSTSNTTSFTINRPPNVVSGDLMIATLTLAGNFTAMTLTGWTVKDHQVSANGDVTHWVYSRFAGASEPGSWTGTLTAGSYGTYEVRATECTAYRNVDPTTPFIAAGSTIKNGGSSLSSAVIANTNSGAWLVAAYNADSNGTAQTWTAGTLGRRANTSAGVNNWFTDEGVVSSWFDSGGPVSTGNQSVLGSYSSSFFGAVSYIALLSPLTVAPLGPGNETSRAQLNIGSSTTIYLGVYDSNGVAPSGTQSATGTFVPGDADGQILSGAGWVGIVRPASPVVQGLAQATMATAVSISSIDPTLLAKAGNRATMTTSFTGTASGTPLLTVNFFRANQSIGSAVVPGTSFGTSAWVKSSATVDVPAGTTRISATVGVQDRNISDVTLFDRVSLALGDETVYRPGTTRAAHPIWALPQLEYADDDGTGYGPWDVIPGSTTLLPPEFDALTGISQYTDHSVVPLHNRKYRAKTVSLGLLGDVFVSAYGPESSEFTFTARTWWLKDIGNPDSNLQLSVKWESIAADTTNTAIAYQPLGEDMPVVLTEGFKSDMFTITVWPIRHNDWLQLKSLITSGKTLFLQSDHDQVWWVRTLGNISSELVPTANWQSDPLRQVKVSFLQVGPEV